MLQTRQTQGCRQFRELSCFNITKTTKKWLYWCFNRICLADLQYGGKGGKEEHFTSMAHSLYGYGDASAERPAAWLSKLSRGLSSALKAQLLSLLSADPPPPQTRGANIQFLHLPGQAPARSDIQKRKRERDRGRDAGREVEETPRVDISMGRKHNCCQLES